MAHHHHTSTYHPSHRSTGTLLAVAIGGSIGTLARYSLGRGFPTAAGHFPTTTLIINLSGSLLIGLILPIALEYAAERPLLRPLLITGILGGWTTYSALAADAAILAKSGHSLLALGDVGATVFGGLLLVALGFYVNPAHTYVRYRRENGR
jgi:fluoride exporter